MMYDDVIRDFAERTRANLSAVEEMKVQGAKVYETTQLVNSCLGILVFPRERYINNIEETPLVELASEGWPIPRVTEPFPQVPHLRALIRYLRNAIAHCNIEFIGDGRNEIRFLRVWNTDPRRKKITWEAELSVEDLRKLADKFSAKLISGIG